MAIYVTLYKLTEQGIKDIKNAPARIEEGIKSFEAMGGKVHGFYSTMGDYDYVGIGEHPSDEAGSAFLLGLGAQGYVRTTTMRAFTVEQFKDIVDKIP